MRRWLYQISQALVYIERKHIIHRDIKLANVLVDGGLSHTPNNKIPNPGLVGAGTFTCIVHKCTAGEFTCIIQTETLKLADF